MANDLIIPGATQTSLTLPDDLTETAWRKIGERIGAVDRVGNYVGWWIGDWWNAGERYGNRVRIVKDDPNWTGPDYGSCRNCGSVAAKFSDVSRRRDTLTFKHHAEVASIAPSKADALLARTIQQQAETGVLMSANTMRQEVKRLKREAREIELAESINEASHEIGHRLYGVILADPPWHFQPYSDDTGMDRAAENHYPTMGIRQIEELGPKIPAADECVLFLWATVPMLIEAIDVMHAWDFDYKSHFIWVKNRIGTGYWTRNKHELLLIGTRGDVPAPSPGQQYDSVFEAAVEEHSTKPAAAAEMIEDMYPHLPKLEMFARQRRLGWDLWGAEAPEPVGTLHGYGIGQQAVPP